MKKSPPMWVFALAFFPLGLGGVALSAGGVIHGYRSLKWPVVSGVVLSSQLSAAPLVGVAQPEVRYSYEFEGNAYVSNRIWPGDVISSMPVMTKKNSLRLINQFSPNQSVAVHVNPADPLDATLIAGPRKARLWLMLFVFFLLVEFWSPLAVGRLFDKKGTINQ